MKNVLMVLLCLIQLSIQSQKLPMEMSFSADGRRLVSGSTDVDGFYNPLKLRIVELKFDQANYWTLLTNNYQSKTDIPATLIYDGVSYPNVGVRFKGQTSYQRVSTQKKSFNITMDFQDLTQDLKGYETLNFNNSYEDNSCIREVLYENITRPYSPSLKANFIHLYINGEDWGLYPNIQALDGEYVKEWFLSNDGTRWRCERQAGPGGPGGGGFGAGTSTLNYLGDDTTAYKPNYILKHTSLENPWNDLVRVTKILNTIPLNQLEDTLNKVLDIDRALWFLAKEILFGDDDSYVNKGGMDYYAIYQKDVERLIPLEYDANSIMKSQTSSWSIFLKETDVKFPLTFRLFAVPALRQRYLAHFRTFFKNTLDSTYFKSRVNEFYSLIDSVVTNDPKKLMTYTAFQAEKNVLLNWMRNRRTFVLNNAEFKQAGNQISEVVFSTDGISFKTPNETQPVLVTAKIVGGPGVKEARLYYSQGYDGYFSKTKMYDDGNHSDGLANDGIYAASIPPFPNGVFVRYYIESVANNTQGTVSYMPEGAEHDVYIYQVDLIKSVNDHIVINELMATNTNTIADQDGEFDDWIELYNKSNYNIDISNWIVTDNPTNLDKYRIPAGTIMSPDSYLVIWADEDGKQSGYHANFKLSAFGEDVLLLDSTGQQVDKVVFTQQETDKAFARSPNGIGNFIIKIATFNKNNDGITKTTSISKSGFNIFPIPASQWISIHSENTNPSEYRIIDALGKTIVSGIILQTATINVSHLLPGVYSFLLDRESKKIIIR